MLVAYDDKGKVTDFGALEVQGVYISGNVRRPFELYMENPPVNANMNWHGKPNYPRPDYLSSSRKRLAPSASLQRGNSKCLGEKDCSSIRQRVLSDFTFF